MVFGHILSPQAPEGLHALLEGQVPFAQGMSVWLASSSWFQPTPTPKASRPPESRSSVGRGLGQGQHIVFEGQGDTGTDKQRGGGAGGGEHVGDIRIHHPQVWLR